MKKVLYFILAILNFDPLSAQESFILTFGYTYEDAQLNTPEVWEETKAIFRQRLLHLGLDSLDFQFRLEGDGLMVDVATLRPKLRRLLLSVGKIEVQAVMDLDTSERIIEQWDQQFREWYLPGLDPSKLGRLYGFDESHYLLNTPRPLIDKIQTKYDDIRFALPSSKWIGDFIKAKYQQKNCKDCPPFYWGIEDDKSKGLYFLKDRPLVLSNYLEDVFLEWDQFGQRNIIIHLDSLGAKKFDQYTQRYLKQKMAFSLDGEVLMAPIVQATIPGGQIQVTGGGLPLEEMEFLIHLVSGGSLPGKLIFKSEQVYKKE
ncbi:MAG: hypothetical protein AAFU64_17120 [Bacteroidota bacterium]